MSFKNEEEFEDYLDELQEDLESENKDRLSKGLDKLGTPPAAGGGRITHTDDDETMSDDEIKELAKD